MLDNVARSKNKKWKNMQTEETKHNFTSWAEQLPSLFQAQLHPLSLERPITLLGFYHLLSLPTLSFSPWLLSRAYIVTLLLQVLWWNTAPLSLTSLLELHISSLKKNTSRSSPASLEKQGREWVTGVYLIPSLLKYKHLLCACVFSVPVFVIQEVLLQALGVGALKNKNGLHKIWQGIKTSSPIAWLGPYPLTSPFR